MLNVNISPGKYIVAVSGGVDSMVLFDIVRRKPNIIIIAAHANHGLRPDAHKDEALIKRYAASHNIVFESARLNLKSASEDEARRARYAFLQQCRVKHKARAILVAHHKDDMLETAIINMLRGTGWRGIAPFTQASGLIRPLLHLNKWQLIGYARTHGLTWREDASNTNERYLRNYIRHTLLPLCDQRSDTWQGDLMRLIRKQQILRRTIEAALTQWTKQHASTVRIMPSAPRHLFIMAPTDVGYELLQAFIRCWRLSGLQGALARSALVFIKTGRSGKTMPLDAEWQLRLAARTFVVERRGSMVS